MTTRRKLIYLLGASAVASPFGSFAQPQGKVWRVGFLGESQQSFYVLRIDAFKVGMRELGYVQGKNLVIETRFADNKIERLPGLVAEMIELKVDAIVAVAPGSISAAQKVTTTIDVQTIQVLSRKDFESTGTRLRTWRADSLYVPSSVINVSNSKLLVEFAAKTRLPAIYPQSNFVSDGGLISYAPNNYDLYRRAAHYVDKILKGTKPADLPVEMPTKFEMVFNMKTAKPLGIKIPDMVMVQVTRVIE